MVVSRYQPVYEEFCEPIDIAYRHQLADCRDLSAHRHMWHWQGKLLARDVMARNHERDRRQGMKVHAPQVDTRETSQPYLNKASSCFYQSFALNKHVTGMGN